MIQGGVNSRLEGIVQIRVKGPTGLELDINAIVDTGFTSSLTLPADLRTALGLIRQSAGTAVLADGSVCEFELYAAEVFWDGAWRQVLVSSVGNEVLLGMRLLAGHELRIRVIPGGAVQIAPIV